MYPTGEEFFDTKEFWIGTAEAGTGRDRFYDDLPFKRRRIDGSLDELKDSLLPLFREFGY
jgi:hypothetical protein